MPSQAKSAGQSWGISCSVFGSGQERYCCDRFLHVSRTYPLHACLQQRPSAVPGDLVFWNQKRPSRPLSVKAIQKKIQRYAKAAAITASCHSLRQTFASNLLEQGAELVSIRELLGHASISSSERYAKLSNQHVKQEYVRTMKKVLQRIKV
jgi:site-specific recombinase XerD